MAVEVSGNQIWLPQGDTGCVKFAADGRLSENHRGIFTLSSRSGAVILRKILVPNPEDNAFHLPLVHDDTAALRPDGYRWSFRLTLDGRFDAKGRITDTNGLHTPIPSGRLIVQRVEGGAR